VPKFYVLVKRIAVVDDEPDITNVLKKGLERNGFTVDTFNDPQAALASKPSPLGVWPCNN
jgi:DNA-binding response OmpR family regulator